MIANRVACGETLEALARANKDIIVVDADVSKSTGMSNIRQNLPEQFIDCGIAEQNMMGIAAGMASCGKTVFAADFAVFTSLRAVEQVRNTICYSNLDVKVIGTHAGLETGADGATHQAIEDIAVMRAIPNINVMIPSSPNAARKITKLAANTYGPFYIRMGKEASVELYDETHEFPLGGSKELISGNYATVMACGNMVEKALEAAKLLEQEGIKISVIDLYSIKPIDKDAIVKAAKETRGIVTIEDHSIIGGLGGAVCEVIAEIAPTKVIRLGVKDVFGRAGDKEGLHKMFGLTSESIVDAVKKL